MTSDSCTCNVLATTKRGGTVHTTRVEQIDSLGRHCRALHRLAAARGHTATVSHLLDAGADVNATNNTGYTALHLAARHGRNSTVLTLLQLGACVRGTTDTDCTS